MSAMWGAQAFCSERANAVPLRNTLICMTFSRVAEPRESRFRDNK